MNAFELLKADHEETTDLFEKIEDTTERATKSRTELFEKLKVALEIHMSIEESILYSIIGDMDDLRDKSLEAIEEHNVCKTLLAEIAELSPEDETWIAKVTVLRENIEHHVEEEEDEIFPKAEKLLGPERVKEMGLQLAEEKKKLLAAYKKGLEAGARH